MIYRMKFSIKELNKEKWKETLLKKRVAVGMFRRMLFLVGFGFFALLYDGTVVHRSYPYYVLGILYKMTLY